MNLEVPLQCTYSFGDSLPFTVYWTPLPDGKGPWTKERVESARIHSLHCTPIETACRKMTDDALTTAIIRLESCLPKGGLTVLGVKDWFETEAKLEALEVRRRAGPDPSTEAAMRELQARQDALAGEKYLVTDAARTQAALWTDRLRWMRARLACIPAREA